MSRINESLYSSDRQDWESPPDFVQAILDIIGQTQFGRDVCCSRKNVPAWFHFIDGFDDGLNESWRCLEKTVWMNPPYNECEKWLKKANQEFTENQDLNIFALIPARPDTRYWHKYVMNENTLVIFIQGRLKFNLNGEPYRNKDGSIGNAPFPAALIVYGSWANRQEFLEGFKAQSVIKGTVLGRIC